MSNYEFIRKNLSLSAEFNAYLLSHPDFLLNLPHKANVVFEVKDDHYFLNKNLEIARKAHQKYVIVSRNDDSWELKRP